MIVTDEMICEEAARHEIFEKTCPKGMKDNYYNGFCEGAKWAFKIAEQNQERLY